MEKINFDSLLFLLKEAKEKNKKILITFHSVGDSDSVSSAIALKRFFGDNAKVSTPDYITTNATRMLKVANINENEISKGFDTDCDIVVLVDVNAFEDCGSFNYYLNDFKGDIVIIDHHALHNIEKDKVYVYNDENSNSTASIIYEIFEQLEFDVDVKIKYLLVYGIISDSATASIIYEIFEQLEFDVDVKIKYLLVYGIISDSADLKNAFPKTFIQIGKLLEDTGSNYQALLNMIEPLPDPKSRLNVLIDSCAAEKYIIGNILFIYGRAHSHANVSADVALKAGADLALFFSIGAEGISFSARLRETLDKKYDLHMGKIMKMLAPIIRGSGGGHPCAAGAYGPVTSTENEFKEAFMEELKKHIS